MRLSSIAAGLLALVACASALAQGAGVRRRADEGKQVYQRANCVGCHKWHGGGGGGYGGSALSLRTSELTREQIVEVLNCGRPGTGMPYHLRGAYDGDGCYGTTREALGKDMPVQPAVFLRPGEIEAVADYVVANVQRRGEPVYAECAAFFGDGARGCNSLKDTETASSSEGKE